MTEFPERAPVPTAHMAAAGPRRATGVQKVLLVAGALVSCALALALAELWCRVFLDVSLQGNSRELFAPRVFGESMGNARNAHGVSFGADAWTDGNGFRFDPAFTQAPAPTSNAILILGDSVGFGVGVPETATFAGLLRQRLHGTTVYNSSVIGYALPDYKNVIDHFLPQHPEVRHVFLSFCLNDVSRLSAAAIEAFLREAPDDDRMGALKRLPFIRTAYPYLRSRSKLYIALRNALTDPSRRTFAGDLEHYAADDEQFDALMQPLGDIAIALSHRGIAFTVLIAPAEPQLRTGAEPSLALPQQRIATYLTHRGIDFLDLLPAFRATKRAPERLYLSGDAMHFSAAGHRVVFDAVVGSLAVPHEPARVTGDGAN